MRGDRVKRWAVTLLALIAFAAISTLWLSCAPEEEAEIEAEAGDLGEEMEEGADEYGEEMEEMGEEIEQPVEEAPSFDEGGYGGGPDEGGSGGEGD